MIIKPKIKSNIALSCHPLGCHENILEQIAFIKKQDKITRPINVLIIGGSSGYGLATRIALAFGSNAFTYNVSFENAPKGRMSGTAGYYNNYYFNEEAKKANLDCVDLNADCFSHQTKEEVINYFKENNKKIDLVVYSVASGVRIDPDTNVKYVSALKPINNSFTGHSFDIITKKTSLITVEPASQEEIDNTIKVMGGEDYLLWIQALDNANVLNEGIKAITYTYIGAPATYPIYKNGTIGQAKRHLEATNTKLNEILSKYHGVSYICSSKSIVTKASTYIPGLALYISALYKVMKEHNVHESIIEHKFRLFKDMIYGDKILLDENNIIRLDSFELDEAIQKEVDELLASVSEDNIDLVEVDTFIKDFMQINGFGYDNIDYDIDIDLEQYL